MSSHNNQTKVAVINDFSGFGRCSIAVSLPVLSVMKVQCCPVVTSIFSNHTGFPSYFFDDYTKHMQAYIDEWKKLELQFRGIYTGFIGSKEQIAIVEQFFRDFKRSNTIVLIDPVMGDYGKPYPTYTMEMCQEMKRLVRYADILTPNLTEACILTDTPYKENWSKQELLDLARKLQAKGAQKVVITGVPRKSFVANFCLDGKSQSMVSVHRVGQSRSGTGDLFASILIADAVNGVDLTESVRKASRFVKHCIERSIALDIPLTDGVCFEEVLHELCMK